ncbi:hypothetical protein EGW08_022317 [Elysia chlorotica]|uniref:Cysteine protease n=1 Tax=Elysia chlorotica TaxID=188477 RepID=A0A433SL95_ELYCH|nr:hypothetical protein EGW08_022317 [Elysia chlorotica]
MEASAKQHRASRNRLSFEDSHAVSKRFSYSRQDDVLSLNSWSDCEKSDTSGSPSRDPDPGLDGSCSSYSKEHRSYNLDHRQPHHLNAKRIGSISTQNIVSNTVTVPRSRPIPNNTNQDATVTSESVRSRSISNIERGPYYGRSLGTQKCVYDHAMCPSTYGSINYEHDIIDQPANPFQDFSYLGFPSHDSTKTKKDLPKEKLNVKTSSNLYPVLKDLEHRPISNGSRSSYPDAQARGSFTFLGDLDDGPVSLPVASSPSNLEQNTPFRSLPASVSLTDKSGLSSHTRSIPPSQDSQRGKKSNKDSQTKGPWSIWKLHQSQPILSKAPSLKRQPKSSSDLEALRESFEHRLEHDNVKTKVLSAWNNFKYGWMFNTKPTLKYDSPLFMLGKCYHMRKEDSDSETADEFLKDFTSRIWMTYRSNFYPIPGTKLNTDCGWGCMLRSAQMLIIQCLVTHYLGREWRIHNPQTETEHAYYREIIRWFSDPVDAPSDIMPFSLHHLVSFGRHYHKEPGEWFGPSSAAYIFRYSLHFFFC